MKRFVRRFDGEEIRIYVSDEQVIMYEAHRIAEVLKLEEPRKTVVNQLIYFQNYKTEMHSFTGKNHDSKFFVDRPFIIHLALKAEESIAERFINWMFVAEQVIINEVRKNYSNTLKTTQIAKMFNISASQLNKILYKERILYKDRQGKWILYKQYEDQGLAVRVHVKTRSDGAKVHHLYWTEKGKKFIEDLLNSLGYYKYGKQLTIDETV